MVSYLEKECFPKYETDLNPLYNQVISGTCIDTILTSAKLSITTRKRKRGPDQECAHTMIIKTSAVEWTRSL